MPRWYEVSCGKVQEGRVNLACVYCPIIVVSLQSRLGQLYVAVQRDVIALNGHTGWKMTIVCRKRESRQHSGMNLYP
jgi:hypothetical protein